MNERIKELRKALKLSQDEFGKRLGLTRGAITNIELNKTEPKPLLIDLICREFDITEEWLRTGAGEMFRPLTRSEVIADFAADLIKDEPESFRRRLVEALAKLGPEEWEILERIAKDLAKKGLRIFLSPTGACKIVKSGEDVLCR